MNEIEQLQSIVDQLKELGLKARVMSGNSPHILGGLSLVNVRDGLKGFKDSFVLKLHNDLIHVFIPYGNNQLEHQTNSVAEAVDFIQNEYLKIKNRFKR